MPNAGQVLKEYFDEQGVDYDKEEMAKIIASCDEVVELEVLAPLKKTHPALYRSILMARAGAHILSKDET